MNHPSPVPNQLFLWHLPINETYRLAVYRENLTSMIPPWCVRGQTEVHSILSWFSKKPFQFNALLSDQYDHQFDSPDSVVKAWHRSSSMYPEAAFQIIWIVLKNIGGDVGQTYVWSDSFQPLKNDGYRRKVVGALTFDHYDWARRCENKENQLKSDPAVFASMANILKGEAALLCNYMNQEIYAAQLEVRQAGSTLESDWKRTETSARDLFSPTVAEWNEIGQELVKKDQIEIPF